MSICDGPHYISAAITKGMVYDDGIALTHVTHSFLD